MDGKDSLPLPLLADMFQRVIDKIPPDAMEQMKKDERARRRAEREER